MFVLEVALAVRIITQIKIRRAWARLRFLGERALLHIADVLRINPRRVAVLEVDLVLVPVAFSLPLRSYSALVKLAVRGPLGCARLAHFVRV